LQGQSAGTVVSQDVDASDQSVAFDRIELDAWADACSTVRARTG